MWQGISYYHQGPNLLPPVTSLTKIKAPKHINANATSAAKPYAVYSSQIGTVNVIAV